MQVTIQKTGKISQSSNVVGTTHYTLEFDPTADWTNTLMGWNGVADTMDQLRNRFRFETPAEAIYFCETNGMCAAHSCWHGLWRTQACLTRNVLSFRNEPTHVLSFNRLEMGADPRSSRDS